MKQNKISNDRLFMICTIILSLIFIFILFAPVMIKYDPNKQDILAKFQHPNTDHLLGTDQLGRDIFARLLYGGRTTLSLSLLATFLTLSSGFIVGWLSAVYRGKINQIVTFLCDMMLSIPSEMIALIIVGLLGPSVATILLAVTLSKWPWYVRMFHHEISSYQQKNYIQFSLITGKSNSWILKNHLLKNIFPLFIIYGTLNLSSVIVSISALSFLGIGIQPPTSEWGSMINEAKNFVFVDIWQVVPVGVVLFCVLASLNYLGDQFGCYLISEESRYNRENKSE